MTVAEAVQIFLDMDAWAAVGLLALVNFAWWFIKALVGEAIPVRMERRERRRG